MAIVKAYTKRKLKFPNCNSMSKYLSVVFFFLILTGLGACKESNYAENFEQAIVYTAEKGSFNLYQIDELGQWEKQLTFSEGQEWSPKWNESFGSIVYYEQNEADQFDVKVLDHPELDSISFNGVGGNLEFFPNGKSVLVTVKDNEAQSQNYHLIEIGSQSIIELTKGNHFNHSASISPDGERLAFVSNVSGTEELYLLKLDGLAMTRLTNNNLGEGFTSWSPDGSQIAFTMREDDINANEDIYVINVDGSGLKQITDTSYPEKEIAWSLDGKKIAFHGTTISDGDQIYSINLEDGRFIKITSGDFYHAEPTWVKVK
jgi:Tol biopolymer transport system component